MVAKPHAQRCRAGLFEANDDERREATDIVVVAIDSKADICVGAGGPNLRCVERMGGIAFLFQKQIPLSRDTRCRAETIVVEGHEANGSIVRKDILCLGKSFGYGYVATAIQIFLNVLVAIHLRTLHWQGRERRPKTEYGAKGIKICFHDE